MHELSIALNILDIAKEEAERNGGGVVQTIHVRLGPLSGVVKEALQSAYELARAQTPLAETRLVVEEVPVRVFCEHCQSEQLSVSIQLLACSTCLTPSRQVVSGRELEIDALEIEV